MSELVEIEPIRVSHSQLRAWNQCRMKWHLQYERRLTPKKTPIPLFVGVTLHEIMEEYYGRIQRGEPHSWGDISEWVQSELPFPKSDEELKSFSHLMKVMKRYIEDYSSVVDNDWFPVHVENKSEFIFETPEGRQAKVVYIPDLIMQHKTSKKLWLWDHKSFRSKPYSDGDLLTEIQIPIYIGAVRRDLNLDIHGAIFNLVNVYEYKNYEAQTLDKLFIRKRTFRTPAEINNVQTLIGMQVDDIEDNRDKVYMNLNKDCSWCSFQDYCINTMKGIDGEEILTNNFQERQR